MTISSMSGLQVIKIDKFDQVYELFCLWKIMQLHFRSFESSNDKFLVHLLNI